MRAWGPAAAWAAFLFFMSARTSLPVDLSRGLDKVAHFGAYLVLGFLLAQGTTYLRLPGWIAIALGLFYGFLDEFHQSRVPGRHADLADWYADATGTLVGVLLFIFVWRSRTLASRRADGAAEGRLHG